MNTNAHIWKALGGPFADWQLKTKPGGKGRDMTYITARTVMNRLDEVVGPENWTADYTPFGADGSVMCRLSILLPNGDKVTKADVGGRSQTQDASDEDKGAVSDALKRAAVLFGIGRYLYQDGVPRMLGPLDPSDLAAEPAAVAVAAPAREEPRALPAPERPDQPTHGLATRNVQPPTTGKGLYGFAKESNSLDWFDQLGRAWNFPARIMNWNPDQVAEALHEYNAKRQPVANGRARWGGGR